MIRERARRAREEAELSQRAVAEQAGIPRSQLQIFENGGNVTLETVEKALNVLGLKLAAVSTGDIAAARKALSVLDAFLAQLAGTSAPPTVVSDEFTPDVRKTIGELDALVDLDDHG